MLLSQRVYITLLAICVLLFGLLLVLIDATDNSQQQVIAFAFTPVPTATASVVEDRPKESLNTDAFSVEIDGASQNCETAPACFTIDVAPSHKVEPIVLLEPTPSDQDNSSRQTSEPITHTDRATLHRNIHSSRTEISNLTYVINVANGVGILNCVQATFYYEKLGAFGSFETLPTLTHANESYEQALNVAIVGVHPLYKYCQSQLGKPGLGEEIAVIDIAPITIWESAVEHSNAALQLSSESADWLDGSVLILNEIYESFESDLETYQQALSDPSSGFCIQLRAAFDDLLQSVTILDLGEGSEFYSSYDKYERAVHLISTSGGDLYQQCDQANLQQTGERGKNSLSMLPLEHIAVAQQGLQEVAALMELAHFYISPISAQANR